MPRLRSVLAADPPRSDEISVNVKAAIGVRNVAMPYVSQFAKIETVKEPVTAYGLKFNFPISGYGGLAL